MNKYKTYCTVHYWQEVISSSEPTVCPVDGVANLLAGSSVIIQENVCCNDGTPTELNLSDYKTLRYNEIDKKTGELISGGFVYGTKTFSLSQNAQINISALNQTRDELTYPINYNTIDDTDKYDVVDAVDMHNMYLTALNTKKGYLDSGTVLKDQIRAATDKAQVDAVIDNR